jgi:hypothetical protein
MILHELEPEKYVRYDCTVNNDDKEMIVSPEKPVCGSVSHIFASRATSTQAFE